MADRLALVHAFRLTEVILRRQGAAAHAAEAGSEGVDHSIVLPPFTLMTWPVMKPASSPAK